MAQDFRSGPNAGYPSPRVNGNYVADKNGTYTYREAHLGQSRSSGAQNFGGAPDPDRYFNDQDVRFAPQSGSPSEAQTGQQTYARHGFAAPQSHYAPRPDTGPDYAYDTTGGDGSSEDFGRPKLGKAQWAGAVVSLALVLGLGVWGYKLMMRDVNGVPVIRALEGSARIVPDDPGGQLAMHQGLAVNSVTADGSAAAPADSLILAPRIATLSDEDQPMSATQTAVSAYEPENTAFAVQPEEPAAAPDMTTVAVEDDPLELDSVEEVASAADVTPEASDLAQSPRPKPRPVRVASLATGATPGASASLEGVAGDILAAIGATDELAPSEVPTGARLVQFGAFQNEEIARSEWDRLSGRFEDLMEGKSRVIEQAESGGTTFYRLRAYGFADASDANRFCAALTAMNAACVPTVQR
ncbi:Sporulation related domain-containing protein [Celeribacter baekdonensis]|uniref:Sporulation related domain-containing protein n=1 Tax=Celeribacter baekdonensis TaxID=875171 RepID=A0A1G7SSW7_9RHOB|nr:SPOR domain-containing protein [Celeribacter baekdonensis]SDG26155.1 Sporulation related domain-containing protein [Celeribacter baekdonensis]